MDGDGSGEDNGEDVDYTNVSLDYAAGPLSVGFSWLRDSAAESDLYGLGAKYNFGSALKAAGAKSTPIRNNFV